MVDGDANSYWESANNAFPQWVQVDLGATRTVGRVVLKLPPSSAWATRTQAPRRAGQRRRGGGGGQLWHAGRVGGLHLQSGQRHPGGAIPNRATKA
ncbi:discoidin domain-containing protein [Micromonospora lupini]|uniref:discoidin domain-containing protein n=1 Tax=Micromonospora lupini TaxID=285679 RepID=UPI003615F860